MLALTSDSEQVLLVKIARAEGAEVFGWESPYVLWRKIVLALGGSLTGNESEQTLMVKAGKLWGADVNQAMFPQDILRKSLVALGGDYSGRESFQRTLFEIATRAEGNAEPPVDLNILFRYSAGDDIAALGGTFTRASLATMRDENGLLRYAPHNYVTRSQEIEHADWVLTAGTKGAAVADPFGGMAARAVSVTAGLNALYNATTLSGPGTHVGSIWIRCASGTASFRIDIVDQAAANNPSADMTATTTWTRFEYTFKTALPQNKFLQITSPTSGAAMNLEIFGGQLERNITASSYLPTGATARFDGIRDSNYEYHPVTQVLERGTLLEDQATNNVLYSEDFTNAAWTKDQSTIAAGAAIGPDGALSASKLFDNTLGTPHYFYESVTMAAGVATASFFLKAGERSIAWIFMDLATVANAYFNLTTGVVGTVSGSGSPSAYMEYWGNGWWRCCLAATVGAGAKNFGCGSALVDNTPAYVGDGTSGIFVFGAQHENRSFASSYIATTNAAATRASDHLAFDFDEPIQEFTVFSRHTKKGLGYGSNARIFQVGDDSEPGRVILYDLNHSSSDDQIAAFVSTGTPLATAGVTSDFPKLHDLVEVLLSVSHSEISIKGALNGGVDFSVSSPGDLATIPFSAPRFGIGCSPDSIFQGFDSFRDVIIAKGVRDLAYFRAKLAPEPNPVLFSYEPGDSIASATFTRASSATYRNSAGIIATAPSGTLRDAHYEFDPVTATYVRTTLLEGQRTNQIVHSTDLRDATTGGFWPILNATCIPSAQLSPENSGSFSLKANAGGGLWGMYMPASPGFTPSTGNYCISVFFKYDNWAQVFIRTLGGSLALFDIQTGAVDNIPSGQDARMENWGNGWWRCSLFGPVPATVDNNIYFGLNGGGVMAGTEKAFVWGPQAEAGSFTSSYIPTSASAVTRAGDLLHFPIDFDPQPLSVYARRTRYGSDVSRGVFQIGPDFNNCMLVDESQADVRTYMQRPGGSAATPSLALAIVGPVLQEDVALGSYKTAGIISSRNGAASAQSVISSNGAFPASWGTKVIYIGTRIDLNTGFSAFQKLKVFKGIRDLAYSRTESAIDLPTLPPPSYVPATEPAPTSFTAPVLTSNADLANPHPGDILTLGNGAWTDLPTFAKQFKHVSDNANATGSGNATGSYTVNSSDLGFALYGRVTATNAAGAASANSNNSGLVTVADPLAGIAFKLRLEPDMFFTDTGATVLAVTDGDLIAAWKCKTTGLIVPQATVGQRPIMKIVSGAKLSRWDGSNDQLSATLAATDRALVFRAKSVAGQSGGVFSDATGASGTHHPYTNGNLYENFATDTRVDSIPPVASTAAWFVYSASNASGTHIMRVNGVQRNSVARTYQARLAFIIGNSHPTPQFAYNGDISHIYICPAANVAAVESYLMSLP